MIKIRSLTEIDRDTLKRLITGYVSEEKYAVTREESDPKSVIALELVRLKQPYVKRYDDVSDEDFGRYQEMLRHGLSLGAYDGDDLIGMAICEPEAWNRSLWVWEFHIAEGQRGKGIGRALMEALVEKGRAAEMRVMVCETQTTNVPAIRFYRKMGFTLDAINLSLYTNEDWPDGEIAVFMKRKLK